MGYRVTARAEVRSARTSTKGTDMYIGGGIVTLLLIILLLILIF